MLFYGQNGKTQKLQKRRNQTVRTQLFQNIAYPQIFPHRIFDTVYDFKNEIFTHYSPHLYSIFCGTSVFYLSRQKKLSAMSEKKMSFLGERQWKWFHFAFHYYYILTFLELELGFFVSVSCGGTQQKKKTKDSLKTNGLRRPKFLCNLIFDWNFSSGFYVIFFQFFSGDDTNLFSFSWRYA